MVDDHPGELTLLSIMLRNAGFEVLKAESAYAALEILKELLPDLFVVDVMMPDVDGLELCRQLRERAETADLPIVMLTARGDTAVVEEAYAAGANTFLTKPVLSHDLLGSVQKLLGDAGNASE